MKRLLLALLITGIYMVFITACGSGGGNGAVPLTVSGVAATGAPVANGTVTLMDSRGVTVTGTTDANGYYSLNVANNFYPFAIRVDWNDGTAHTLYSYARIPGNSANINPMTNIAVINASAASSLANFASGYFNSADRSMLTQVAGNIDLALSDIQTKLNPLLAAFAATSTNPFSVNYVVGTLGLDKMFDLVAFDVTASSVTLSNRINSSVICSGLINNVPAWVVTAANIPDVLGSLSITSVSPSSGTAGDHIVITGTGFIANPALNSVKIGNVAATVSAATSTTIDFIIPVGAVTGKVSVNNVYGTVQSSVSLVVL